ncbi:hypothetical protein ASAC_0688 [Acidilobus saccharovorans 345-15]|uniref:Uncharacterized protein n=1 Tax=Acidilobus saccharovorans (strain DSM 16705 / JCM 18335 / VKM B-2471 / 345-15) TaxID=666510 RepID=D9Q1A6_ACIS3|nr:hypothetical protein ASAC_0688 [Acidilobus saccharovorans 345-15]
MLKVQEGLRRQPLGELAMCDLGSLRDILKVAGRPQSWSPSERAADIKGVTDRDGPVRKKSQGETLPSGLQA